MMKECKLVTMEDWAEAGDFDKAANPGDMVEEEIVDEFLNCLPPAKMGYGYLQVGEPYSHEYSLKHQRFLPTFATFQMHGEDWFYCGHCFLGEDKEPLSEKGV